MVFTNLQASATRTFSNFQGYTASTTVDSAVYKPECALLDLSTIVFVCWYNVINYFYAISVDIHDHVIVTMIL